LMAKARSKKRDAGTHLFKMALLHAKDQNIRRILIVTRKPLEWDLVRDLSLSIPILLAADTRMKDLPGIKGIETMRMELPDTTCLEWLELCFQEGLKSGNLRRGTRLLCLFPLTPTSNIDTMSVVRLRDKTEYLSIQRLARLSDSIAPEIIEAVIRVATQLAREGREGVPVGSLFVVGDSQKTMQLSYPMILNPFHGYPQSQRRIDDPALMETVKELAQIDGAFVIREDGVILGAGRYIDTPAREIRVPKGLGARHVAAAAISRATDAIAVTVSATSRTVRVFRKGRIAMENKPLRELRI